MKHLEFYEVVLFDNGSTLAARGLLLNGQYRLVSRHDPRDAEPFFGSKCATDSLARYLFEWSIRVSEANGWAVFYRGRPLDG